SRRTRPPASASGRWPLYFPLLAARGRAAQAAVLPAPGRSAAGPLGPRTRLSARPLYFPLLAAPRPGRSGHGLAYRLALCTSRSPAALAAGPLGPRTRLSARPLSEGLVETAVPALTGGEPAGALACLARLDDGQSMPVLVVERGIEVHRPLFVCGHAIGPQAPPRKVGQLAAPLEGRRQGLAGVG